MTPLANIQAEGDDLGGLLKLLAIVAVGIVIAAAKWLGNKLEKKQAEQQAAEQARRQLEAKEAPQTSSPPQQPPYEMPHASQSRRKPQAAPAPPIMLEPARQHGLVDAGGALPSAVRHDAYLRPVRERMGAAARPPSAVRVDLSDPDALRQAVIYHELLSPPKALRRDPEQWDI